MSNEGEGRHWKDWPGLLKWSLQYQDGLHESEFKEMDPERRKWLQESLQSISTSEVDVIIEKLKIIVTDAQLYFEDGMSEDEQKKREDALQAICDVVDNLDNAKDLIPLGGFEPILGLLNCNYHNFRKVAADVIAVSLQNHPDCQSYALKNGAVSALLLSFSTSSSSPQTLYSLFSAISSLVRGSSPAYPQFIEKGGIKFIISVLHDFQQDGKLVTKSIFLLSSLLRDHGELLGEVIESKTIETLIQIIQIQTDWVSREPCLCLLSELSSERAVVERYKAAGLLPILLAMRKEISQSGQEEKHLEVVDYLNHITRRENINVTRPLEIHKSKRVMLVIRNRIY